MYTQQIDALYDLRLKRLALQKEVDEMHEEEKRLTSWLLDAMESHNLYELRGTDSKVVVKEKRKPVVESWSDLYQYILASGSIDLLQQRLKESAVAERWQVGNDVPGVGYNDIMELSITAVKK